MQVFVMVSSLLSCTWGKFHNRKTTQRKRAGSTGACRKVAEELPVNGAGGLNTLSLLPQNSVQNHGKGTPKALVPRNKVNGTMLRVVVMTSQPPLN